MQAHLSVGAGSIVVVGGRGTVAIPSLLRISPATTAQRVFMAESSGDTNQQRRRARATLDWLRSSTLVCSTR